MAHNELAIRLMKQGEEVAVARLVEGVFSEDIAPLYSAEGIREFHRYINPDRLAKRSITNHIVLVAEFGSGIVGVIEIREYQHISLFFICREYQGQGIGRNLLDEALRVCTQEKDSISDITVHSSPNAVDAYKHLGFEALEGERQESGIRYVPMKLRVSG